MKYLTNEEYKKLSPVKKQVYDERMERNRKRHMLEVVIPGYRGQVPVFAYASCLCRMSWANPRLYYAAQQYATVMMAREYLKQMLESEKKGES